MEALHNQHIVVSWSSLPNGVLEFSVEDAALKKPGLTRIIVVLRNDKEEVLFMFSKYVGGWVLNIQIRLASAI